MGVRVGGLGRFVGGGGEGPLEKVWWSPVLLFFILVTQSAARQKAQDKLQKLDLLI